MESLNNYIDMFKSQNKNMPFYHVKSNSVSNADLKQTTT